ncbi:hypothetical protein COW53_00320 [bacterium CG17_big_fil_post_rev_8_21_14_2_50_64_8]|nr:MAG: hypothetical protein COW53_00320 [bacterium CG17_big_fil_post_rev_8_21_14_2_50_64_8]PJA74555.1 MAG: hypothetical protein CO151_09270 [bacterium CG_4_9_14_3_um_filter_65_15]
MPATIYSAEYYYTTVRDAPGQGCRFLETLAAEEVNLLAFNAFPVGKDTMQLVIYPLNSVWLGRMARHEGLELTGPHHAFIVHGDDELGALLEIHRKLCDAEINISSSNGITDGRGGYRYILHVHPADFSRARDVLGVREDVSTAADFHLEFHRRFEAKS